MGVRDADNHKLSLYPMEVTKVLKGEVDNSLLQVEIGVTNACNNKCVYCSLQWIKRDRSYIDTPSLLNSFEDMKELGTRAVYFAGEGEPLLHKDLPKFVKKAYDSGIKVSMSTNGLLLTEEKAKEILPYLSWMRTGLDAATPETYEKVHGINRDYFKRVIKNLETAAKIKRDNKYSVEIGIQSLALPNNIHEIENLTKIVRDIGVDNIQIKPYSTHPNIGQNDLFVNPHDPVMKDLQRKVESYETDDFTVVYRAQTMERQITERPYDRCDGLHFWTLIEAHGNVVPCHVLYEKPEFFFGDITKQTFKEIWTGPRRKEVLEEIAKMDKCNTCKDYKCRPDLFNRYMHRLNNPEKNDDFI